MVITKSLVVAHHLCQIALTIDLTTTAGAQQFLEQAQQILEANYHQNERQLRQAIEALRVGNSQVEQHIQAIRERHARQGQQNSASETSLRTQC